MFLALCFSRNELSAFLCAAESWDCRLGRSLHIPCTPSEKLEGFTQEVSGLGGAPPAPLLCGPLSAHRAWQVTSAPGPAHVLISPAQSTSSLPVRVRTPPRVWGGERLRFLAGRRNSLSEEAGTSLWDAVQTLLLTAAECPQEEPARSSPGSG